MQRATKTCSGCGRNLNDVKANSDGVTICPDCGGTIGILHVTVTETLGFSKSIKGKTKDKSGRITHEFKQKDDVSAATGKPVIKSIDADRSQPNSKPIVTHTVQEVDKLTGHTKIIHKHRK
mgnify:CR=1 FL=1